MIHSSIRLIPSAVMIWKLWLTLAWGLWWGGLCFYAIVVVPVGTGILGSVGQGFVTQSVTWWHNAITGLFILCLGFEAYRRRCRTLGIGAGVLVVVTIALSAWHSRLTGLMDFTARTVPETFYDEHAVYLWITAVEWGIGLILPVWLFRTSLCQDPQEISTST